MKRMGRHDQAKARVLSGARVPRFRGSKRTTRKLDCRSSVSLAFHHDGKDQTTLVGINREDVPAHLERQGLHHGGVVSAALCLDDRQAPPETRARHTMGIPGLPLDSAPPHVDRFVHATDSGQSLALEIEDRSGLERVARDDVAVLVDQRESGIEASSLDKMRRLDPNVLGLSTCPTETLIELHRDRR
jgi:hypothetical protein